MVELKHIRFAQKEYSNGNIGFSKDDHYGYLTINMEHKRIQEFKQLIILQEFFGVGAETKIYTDYGITFVKLIFWLKDVNYSINTNVITLSRNIQSDIYLGGCCHHCNAML